MQGRSRRQSILSGRLCGRINKTIAGGFVAFISGAAQGVDIWKAQII